MGFTNSLLEIITKQKPTHIGVAFDTHAPTFRHEAFKAYKAMRQEQPEEIGIAIPYCKKIVEGFNIPILEKDGYEADDLIGTIAKKASVHGFSVYMVTPDKDFAQLVNENIFLYKPARMGNGVEVMGTPEVLAKFDIDQVDQVRDFLGLKGDAVDNIPGIPGIGDKTASKLLRAFGTVERIIENVDKLKGAQKKQVQEFGQQGIMSKKLATIKIDSPIDFDEEDLSYKNPDMAKLKPIFEELEFRIIAKRVFSEEKDINVGDSNQLGLFSSKSTPAEFIGNSIETTDHNYHLVTDADQITELIQKLETAAAFCFDTETTSLKTRDARLVGIAFSMEKGEAWYVNCLDSPNEVISKFKKVLEDPSIEKIGQNLKYDIQILRNYGITVRGKIFDTMLAHFLLDPESANSMDLLAERHLNYKTIPYEEVAGPRGKDQKTIDQIDPNIVSDYACEDADVTLQLKEVLAEKIDEQDLNKLLDEVEEPLSFVLAEMEYEGVKVDTEVLGKMSGELDEVSKEVQQEIFELAGVDFNIRSPKQLGEILFEKLKLVEKPKKTKSGQYATGEDILLKLANEHPIASKILAFREYQKLKSTYVDALPKLISPASHRIHTDYRQTVATTGRLSSNNPNLQNIPVRTEKGKEIRKAFIPSSDDHLIMSADYSQIELRIMAAFSKDESMISAFNNGVDIHANTAAKVFSVDLTGVEPHMRRKAKKVNFGIIYGISAFGLSQNLNISRGEAQEIIDAYFAQFPNIKKYMDETIEKARKDQFVKTILGRHRYLRNINSKNFLMRDVDERNAINTPIQGSAADIIKIAMINIHEWMRNENLRSKMIMQVHDELVFDMHKEEQDFLKRKVEEFMKHAYPLKVPMEIGIGVGENWLKAH